MELKTATILNSFTVLKLIIVNKINHSMSNLERIYINFEEKNTNYITFIHRYFSKNKFIDFNIYS